MQPAAASRIKTIVTADNRTVHRLTYRKKKTPLPESFKQERDRNATGAASENTEATSTFNFAATSFPEIYSHDGETHMQQVFDFYLSQGHVIRFKAASSDLIMRLSLIQLTVLCPAGTTTLRGLSLIHI